MVAKKGSIKKRSDKKQAKKIASTKNVAKQTKIASEREFDREHHINLALEAAQVGIWEWFIKT